MAPRNTHEGRYAAGDNLLFAIVACVAAMVLAGLCGLGLLAYEMTRPVPSHASPAAQLLEDVPAIEAFDA